MTADGNGDIDISDDALQKFLGTSSFGRQDRRADPDRQFQESKVRNMTKTDATENGNGSKAALDSEDEAQSEPNSQNDKDSDDDSEDDSDEEPEFPTTHSLKIPTHSRAVTTVTLDPSGVRLVTGSLDNTLKLHDLSSLTSTTIRAFKSVDPCNPKPTAASNAESHAIHTVMFNPHAPSSLLVVDATAQPKVLSRDGDVLSEFMKGDMYLRDMNNTKGHVSETTCGTWHPTRKELFVTAGTDSTLRIWDVEKPRQQKDVIVFKSKAAGHAGRSRMTAVVWGAQSDEGAQNCLLGTALDGTLVLYHGEGPYSRPAAEIRDAHKAGTWTSGIDISPDGRLVVTKGGDDTIKVWDLRKFKTPVNTTHHENPSSQYPTSNIRFSPTGGNIITGGIDGSLFVLNPATLRPEATVPVTPGKPLITVLWHHKLNQIVTGSSNSETHILYDPQISNNGAKLIMSKAPKRRHIDDDPSLTTDMSQGISGDAIIVPGGTVPSSASFASRHPNVGLTASGRSRDPRRPHQPASTPFAKTNPAEGYVRDQIPLSSMRDEDPREALLRYAEKAKSDPVFTAAWSETQPKTIYGELSDDEEEDERESKRARK
ncbi:hypothetical protein ANO11243_046980 [Dothideomycetidae sp. 11243]|nr:hypothetical protein ANO11243_046980 [fungal sp. No.11243]